MHSARYLIGVKSPIVLKRGLPLSVQRKKHFAERSSRGKKSKTTFDGQLHCPQILQYDSACKEGTAKVNHSSFLQIGTPIRVFRIDNH